MESATARQFQANGILPYYAPLTFIYRKEKSDLPLNLRILKTRISQIYGVSGSPHQYSGLQMLLWMAKPVEKDQFRGYLKSLMPSK